MISHHHDSERKINLKNPKSFQKKKKNSKAMKRELTLWMIKINLSIKNHQFF